MFNRRPLEASLREDADEAIKERKIGIFYFSAFIRVDLRLSLFL
jgi:hypothetical protein